MVVTEETLYAKAKRNKLYLPPIEDGNVLRDMRGDGLHFPAGLVGSQKIRYAPQPCDEEPSYAYRRREFQ